MNNNVDDEWLSYLSQSCEGTEPKKPKMSIGPVLTDIPKCEELYISTTTKVIFLNRPVDIANVFWEIPIIDFWLPKIGIIKKQMKMVAHTPDEYEEYRKKLQYINYYKEHIIKHIDNPSARRHKYKDERKLTVGMSKKDIMNCRGKEKNAFYNCFAIILRFIYKGDYRELHVKVFNTGKLEIPGVLNNDLLDTAKIMVLQLLRPITDDPTLDFGNDKKDNSVLINSNFNCGFFINREKLYSILRNKYQIETAYDSCSYPGVKCKFYYNHEFGEDTAKQCGRVMSTDHVQKMSELNSNVKYTEISFMIFRTGSCLIVGNCTEPILRFVYAFIKQMLHDEFSSIYMDTEPSTVKPKQVKIRKKLVTVTKEYFTQKISNA
jgi:hypothetical protein